MHPPTHSPANVAFDMDIGHDHRERLRFDSPTAHLYLGRSATSTTNLNARHGTRAASHHEACLRALIRSQLCLLLHVVQSGQHASGHIAVRKPFRYRILFGREHPGPSRRTLPFGRRVPAVGIIIGTLITSREPKKKKKKGI